jgi:arabinogalactan endo-1,4-beta-galactosidase
MVWDLRSGEWISFKGNQAANGSTENQAFYDFNNRALPVWQVLINKKI